MKSRFLLILFLIAEINSTVQNVRLVQCVNNVPVIKCHQSVKCICKKNVSLKVNNCVRSLCAMYLKMQLITCENGVITTAEKSMTNCCPTYLCKK